jgi:hypothetical protein
VEVIYVLLFFGADLALVVAGLLWLSGRRAENDITDLRRPRRYR